MSEQEERGTDWLPPAAPGLPPPESRPPRPPLPPQPSFPQTPPPPPQSPAPAQQPPAGGYAPQQPIGQIPPGNGSAVAGFVLSLVSIALIVISAGLLVLLLVPIVCAVLGIVFGRLGRKRVDDGITAEHRSLAQAGYVMGIVATVLCAISLAVWIIVLASDPDFFDDVNTDTVVLLLAA